MNDDDWTEKRLTEKTLDEDIAALLSLGLQLSDVEKLWRNNKNVSMEDVYASGTRLLGRPFAGLPIKRQVTVGLEIARSGPSRGDILPGLADLLRNELDDPPDHFKDPIMLTLMSDPVVLSSGHVFDHATVYDGPTFRFQCCPMTRERVEQRAYPLVYLKSQLIDFKIRRLTGILTAVRANMPTDDEHTRVALLSLLDVGAQLLSGLEKVSTYEHHAGDYFLCRKELVPPEQWPLLVRELSTTLTAFAKHGTERLAELQVVYDALLKSLQDAVRARWLQGKVVEASSLAQEGTSASATKPEEAASWLALFDELLSPIAALARNNAQAHAEVSPAFHHVCILLRSCVSLVR